MMIMEISIGGLLAFVLVLIMLSILSWKWKRRVKDSIRDPRLEAITGGVVNNGASTSECDVIEELEMETMKTK